MVERKRKKQVKSNTSSHAVLELSELLEGQRHIEYQHLQGLGKGIVIR